MVLDVFIADLVLKDKSFKACVLITEISWLNVAYFINPEKIYATSWSNIQKCNSRILPRSEYCSFCKKDSS